MRKTTNETSRTCGSPEHQLHRRLFLQGSMAAGTASVASFSGLFSIPAIADETKRQGKKCILLWLCGAPSQFETWDPKPGTETGGPFAAINTNLPGVQISSLMPKCATIMDKLAVIRSMKTEPSEHFQGIDVLTRGDKPRPPFTRPILGSVIAQQLGQLDSPVPQFVLLGSLPAKATSSSVQGWQLGRLVGRRVRAGSRRRRLFDSEYRETGDDFGSWIMPIAKRCEAFFSRKYENDRRSDAAASHNAAFDRVKGLMSCAPLFDLNKSARGGSRAIRRRRVRPACVAGTSLDRKRFDLCDGCQRHALGQSRLSARDASDVGAGAGQRPVPIGQRPGSIAACCRTRW